MSGTNNFPRLYSDLAIALAHPYSFDTVDANGNSFTGFRDIARYRFSGRGLSYISRKTGTAIALSSVNGLSLDTLEHLVKEGDMVIENKGYGSDSLTNNLFEYKKELELSGKNLSELRSNLKGTLSEAAKKLGLAIRFSYHKKSVFPNIRLLVNKGWAASILVSPVTDNAIQLVPLLGPWTVTRNTNNNIELATDVLAMIYNFKAELENKGFTVTI